MADLLREFTDPAVMDIKMGVRYVCGEGSGEGREVVRICLFRVVCFPECWCVHSRVVCFSTTLM